MGEDGSRIIVVPLGCANNDEILNRLCRKLTILVRGCPYPSFLTIKASIKTVPDLKKKLKCLWRACAAVERTEGVKSSHLRISEKEGESRA